jgi:hypothetical protein
MSSVVSKFLGKVYGPNDSATFKQLQLNNGVDDGAVIDSVKVTLTSAQILALNTTPITLIPAQGANTYIEVLACVAYLKFNSAAYTGANAANITYTNAAGAAATGTLASSFLDSSSSAAAKVIPAAVTPVVNSPIVISVGTANPAAGNSTITLDLFYRVVTLS